MVFNSQRKLTFIVSMTREYNLTVNLSISYISGVNAEVLRGPRGNKINATISRT